MNVTSLAYRTELIYHGFDGEIIDRGDYLVVRSPRNPGYYSGNLLVFPTAPGAGDAARWEALFAREFADMGVGHVTFGWDPDDPGDPSELKAAGFSIENDVVLATQTPQPARSVDGLTIRTMQGDDDWRRVRDLNIACDEQGRTSEAFMLYQERNFARKRAMSEAGLGHWMGGFMDGRLVAHMGIYRGAELARFADVETHPDYRKRGIAGAMVVETTRVGLEELGATTAVIIANPDTSAERIYRGAGFTEDSRTHAAMRTPQKD